MGPLDSEWISWQNDTFGIDALTKEETKAESSRVKVSFASEDEVSRLHQIEQDHLGCAASRENDNSYLIRERAKTEEELSDTQDELENAEDALRKLAVAWKNSHDSKHNEVVLVQYAVSSIVEKVDPDMATLLDAVLSEWGPSL